MNTATKNLENDHEYILRLIDVMEKMANSSATDIIRFETVVGLIKNYADGYHHAKEENLLFPLLAKKGFSPGQGPIAVMLHDHAEGRNYVKAMAENIESFKNGKDSALKEIHTNMMGYINLLRNHIAKENNVLFRMADNVLSENEQMELLKEFARVEENNFSGGVLNTYIESIEKLESEYSK